MRRTQQLRVDQLMSSDLLSGAAYRAVEFSLQDARSRHKQQVGTYNLLRGILHQRLSTAVAVLTLMGTCRDLRADLRASSDLRSQISGVATRHPTRIPFSSCATRAIRGSFQFLAAHGFPMLGTDYLLISLAEEKHGKAGQLLRFRSGSPLRIRRALSKHRLSQLHSFEPDGDES